jgi:rhodanese-related sulfurtransferase
MTLQLMFDPTTGRARGAQAVGGADVDRRINVRVAAIQAGMAALHLEEMEFAYSPHSGSAKDPINIAVFYAGGMLWGEYLQVDVESLLAAPAAERLFLLDFRTSEEFSSGHTPRAANIPFDDLRSRLSELPLNRKIADNCQMGQRGYLATWILLQSSYSTVNVSGSYKSYKLFHPSTT